MNGTSPSRGQGEVSGSSNESAKKESVVFHLNQPKGNAMNIDIVIATLLIELALWILNRIQNSTPTWSASRDYYNKRLMARGRS